MNDVLKLIKEEKAGVSLEKLPVGTRLEVHTKNSVYKLEKRTERNYTTQGGRSFNNPTDVKITGSTWGGSMIKINWLGIGMHAEMYYDGSLGENRCVTTTAIQKIKVTAHDGSWEYMVL